MLLKVQCEKCKTKYKLDESRIQGKGAKITCPKCRHVFVVLRDAVVEDELEDDDSMGKTQIVNSGSMAAAIAATVPATQPEPAPANPAVPVEDDVPRPRTADELSWKEVGLTAFKVKVAIGLVYDFSDVSTLRKYISEKRVVPTDRLSFDAKTWHVIKEIPNLDSFFIDQWIALKKERLKAGPAPVGASPATGTGPGKPRTTSSGKSGAELEGPKTGNRKQKTAWSSDAAPETGGLLGKGLFDDLEVHEQAGARGATRDARGEGDARGAAQVPLPELRSPGPTSTALLRDSSRAAPPPGAFPSRGLRAGEIFTLLLMVVVAGYLSWQLVQEVQAAEPPASIDIAAEKLALENLMKEHFPVALLSSAPAPAPDSAGRDPKVLDPRAQQGANPAAASEGTKPQGTSPSDTAPPRTTTDPAAPAPAGKSGANKAPSTSGSVSVGAITANDLYQLATDSLRGRDYEGAIQSLKAAVEMKPQEQKFVYLLGYAQYLAGKTSDAEAALLRSLSLGKKNPEANKWLGELYAKRGDKSRAVEAFEQYLQSGPSDAAAIRSRVEQLSNP